MARSGLVGYLLVVELKASKDRAGGVSTGSGTEGWVARSGLVGYVLVVELKDG